MEGKAIMRSDLCIIKRRFYNTYDQTFSKVFCNKKAPKTIVLSAFGFG